MTVQTRELTYESSGVIFHSTMAWDDTLGPRPAVLVAPTWAGCTDFEREQALRLAGLGYVGLAVDMYGGGAVGADKAECTALMTPMMSDRALLQARIGAAVDAIRIQPEAADEAVAAIGFCFGGLCVLDLARTRQDIAGVVSLHGLLLPADNVSDPDIRAKVLVLHGYDDPMVLPEQMLAFTTEMTATGCDWQLHAYGQTLHAFTNPEANDPDFGTVYSPTASRRAYRALDDFLSEVLS
jgi:dienelactone hydrolase